MRGWFVSSYSNGDGCVEVKFEGDLVRIRDSKYGRNPDNDPGRQPIMTVPVNSWNEFLQNVVSRSNGDQDGYIAIEPDEAGGATLRAASGTALTYIKVEWDAFVAGVVAGEFAALDCLATGGEGRAGSVLSNNGLSNNGFR